jgi:hypothetical protein
MLGLYRINLSSNDNDSDFEGDDNDNDNDDSDVRPGSFNSVRGNGGKCDESGGLRNKQFPFLCHGNFQKYQMTEKCAIQGMWSCI